MPEYLAPGVYIEEISGSQPIAGVSTSTTGFVGMTVRGPSSGHPQLVASFPDFVLPKIAGDDDSLLNTLRKRHRSLCCGSSGAGDHPVAKQTDDVQGKACGSVGTR